MEQESVNQVEDILLGESGSKLWDDAPVRSVDPRGYVRLQLPNHPLAMKDGEVGRHRVVLHDAIDPGDAPCHFCGFVLPWKSDKQPAYRYVINADHINNMPGDDRDENLRPTCWWCNANRSWGEAVAPLWFERFCRWFAQVHPAERPNMPNMATEVIGINPMLLLGTGRAANAN